MRSTEARLRRRHAAKQPCTHAVGKARVFGALALSSGWRASVQVVCGCKAEFAFPMSADHGELPDMATLQASLHAEWTKLNRAEREERRVRDDESKKVARCPSCTAWFPSFAERNRHREEERSPAAAARRLREAATEYELAQEE